MSDKTKKAFETIKQSMIDDEPGKPGSYSHSWHCNIAMMCYDALLSHAEKNDYYQDHNQALIIGNDAASRFMKLCFGVETKA